MYSDLHNRLTRRNMSPTASVYRCDKHCLYDATVPLAATGHVPYMYTGRYHGYRNTQTVCIHVLRCTAGYSRGETNAVSIDLGCCNDKLFLMSIISIGRIQTKFPMQPLHDTTQLRASPKTTPARVPPSHLRHPAPKHLFK